MNLRFDVENHCQPTSNCPQATPHPTAPPHQEGAESSPCRELVLVYSAVQLIVDVHSNRDVLSRPLDQFPFFAVRNINTADLEEGEHHVALECILSAGSNNRWSNSSAGILPEKE
jgi:hypothetical protein